MRECGRGEGAMASILCKQKVTGRRKPIPRIGESRFCVSYSVKETKVILSCTHDISFDKLPFEPNTPETESFREIS